MPVVEKALVSYDDSLSEILIEIDRHTLQKRRWRKTASDETDFAFALDTPLQHGDVVWQTEQFIYKISQTKEEVIVVTLPDESQQAAKLGWLLGNMHQPIEVRECIVLMIDELTIRQKLEASHISYTKEKQIFSPPPHSSHHHAH